MRPDPPVTATVFALQIIGSTLYIGGAFANGAGIASADFLLACDLNTGAARSTVAKDGDFTGGVLRADRRQQRRAVRRRRIHQRRRHSCRRQGRLPRRQRLACDGLGSRAWWRRRHRLRASLASNGTDVYVGTDSTNVAGIAQADHVVKWNGSAWSALGSNTAGTDGWFPTSAPINSLTVSGSRVFAGGQLPERERRSGRRPDRRLRRERLAPGRLERRRERPAGRQRHGARHVRRQARRGRQLHPRRREPARGLRRLASASGRGVAHPAAGTPTGTPTGTVLLNGRPFTGGPIPYGSKLDVTTDAHAHHRHRHVTVYGAGGVSAVFVLLRGTDLGKPIVEFRLTSGNFSACQAQD